MRKAAISLSKLADTAREELPSTMAALRLSGMEISDLTLELSDLRYCNFFCILSVKQVQFFIGNKLTILVMIFPQRTTPNSFSTRK